MEYVLLLKNKVSMHACMDLLSFVASKPFFSPKESPDALQATLRPVLFLQSVAVLSRWTACQSTRMNDAASPNKASFLVIKKIKNKNPNKAPRAAVSRMVARHDWRRHGWVIRSGRQALAKRPAVAHHVRTAHVAADMSRERRGGGPIPRGPADIPAAALHVPAQQTPARPVCPGRHVGSCVARQQPAFPARHRAWLLLSLRLTRSAVEARSLLEENVAMTKRRRERSAARGDSRPPPADRRQSTGPRPHTAG